MSNLLGARELSPVATQLPLHWYFDESIHQRELDLLFKNAAERGMRFHALSVR